MTILDSDGMENQQLLLFHPRNIKELEGTVQVNSTITLVLVAKNILEVQRKHQEFQLETLSLFFTWNLILILIVHISMLKVFSFKN